MGTPYPGDSLGHLFIRRKKPKPPLHLREWPPLEVINQFTPGSQLKSNTLFIHKLLTLTEHRWLWTRPNTTTAG